MTNIEKLALDICRMKHSDKVMAALKAAMPQIVETLKKDKEENAA